MSQWRDSWTNIKIKWDKGWALAQPCTAWQRAEPKGTLPHLGNDPEAELGIIAPPYLFFPFLNSRPSLFPPFLLLCSQKWKETFIYVRHFLINVDKYIEFIYYPYWFIVLPHLISQNQDLAFRIGSGYMETIFHTHIYFQYCFSSAWHRDSRKTQHIFLRPWGEMPFGVAQNYLPVSSWWKCVPRVIIWKWAAGSCCWSCHLRSSSLSGWRILQSTCIQGQGISLLFSMLLTKMDGSWNSLIQDSVEYQRECMPWSEHPFPDRLGCHFNRDLCI